MEQLGRGRERERERERELEFLKNSYRTKGSYFVRPDADPFSVDSVADARRTLGAEGEFVDLRSEVEHVFAARLHGGKKKYYFCKKGGVKNAGELEAVLAQSETHLLLRFIACLTA